MASKVCSKCGIGVRLSYSEVCKECQSAHNRAYYAANRERIKAKVRERTAANRGAVNAAGVRRDRERRLEALTAYGGKCACCGEHRHEFLSIDHVNGGGKAERIANNLNGGTAFFAWLRKRGYPQGDYRVLCHSCNQSLGFYGYCPHQRNDPDADLSKMQRFDPEAIRRVLSPVPECRAQGMEAEERSPGQEGAEGTVRRQQGSGIGVQEGEERRIEDADDRRVWRQMRMLWGD